MAAGDTYTILRPKIYIANLGSVLPALPTPTFANPKPAVTWPAAWKRVKRTGNGANITMTAAMQDITSDEVGVIGVVGAGTESVSIAFQSRTPDMNLVQKLSHYNKTVVAAAAGPPAVPQHDLYRLDVGSQPFMIGIEGDMDPNSLTDGGGKVLAFGYNVIQTENTQIAMRTTGSDAIVTPAANVRCLPTVLLASQVTGTGLTLGSLDEKFNLIVLPAPTS